MFGPFKDVPIATMVAGSLLIAVASAQGPVAPPAAGMRVYTDPDTRQFLDQPRFDLPAPSFPAPGRPNELPLDREELVDGTVAIHFRDTFQHQLTAHVGSDGRVHVGCTQTDHGKD